MNTKEQVLSVLTKSLSNRLEILNNKPTIDMNDIYDWDNDPPWYFLFTAKDIKLLNNIRDAYCCNLPEKELSDAIKNDINFKKLMEVNVNYLQTYFIEYFTRNILEQFRSCREEFEYKKEKLQLQQERKLQQKIQKEKEAAEKRAYNQQKKQQEKLKKSAINKVKKLLKQSDLTEAEIQALGIKQF